MFSVLVAYDTELLLEFRVELLAGKKREIRPIRIYGSFA